MATLTVYSDTSDGNVQSTDASYSNARSGTGSLFQAVTSLSADNVNWHLQGGDYVIYELFFAYDTSSLEAGDTVDSVALSYYATFYGNNDTWDDVLCRLYDWGASLTTADWRATNGTSSGDTLLAKLAAASWATDAYNTLNSEAAFVSNINKAGDTRLYLLISNSESATAPTDVNFVKVVMAEESGTTQDPRLVVTYTPPTAEGTLAASLPSLTAALAGEHAQSGTLSSLLSTFTASFSGVMVPAGPAAVQLTPLTAALAAEQGQSGTLAAELPAMAAALHGTIPASGTVATALPALQTSMAAELPGGIASTLPALQASAEGEHSQSGAAATELPPLAVSLAATHGQSGTVTQALPPMATAMTGSQLYTATMAVALPMLAVQFSQEVVNARYPYVGRASTVSPAPGRARLKES